MARAVFRRTPAMVQSIQDCRARGMTWAAISAQLGLPRQTAANIWHKTNRASRPSLPAPACPTLAPLPDPDVGVRAGWDVLPAGHPTTWGVLTDAPWPGQVTT